MADDARLFSSMKRRHFANEATAAVGKNHSRSLSEL
jgi:hypothetical protein